MTPSITPIHKDPPPPRNKPRDLADEATTEVAAQQIQQPKQQLEAKPENPFALLAKQAIEAVKQVAAQAVPVQAPELLLHKPTPLEQAIEDLIRDRMGQTIDEVLPEPKREEPQGHDEPAPLPAPPAAPEPMRREVAVKPPPALDFAEPIAQPASDPNHVHLVIDDGRERLVVTVAVRGNDVNVTLRGGDDATASALARNAGLLDRALQVQGLDLAELAHHSDPERRDKPRYQARERDTQTEQFHLEETP